MRSGRRDEWDLLGWVLVIWGLIVGLLVLAFRAEATAPPGIRPGFGIGQVAVGLSVETVMDMMGLPSWAERNEALNVMDVGYDAEGLIVAFTPDGKAFFVTTYEARYKDAHGLGVGSQAADVERAYGAPGKRLQSGEAITVWIYKDRGMAWMVKQGVVVSVGVFGPVFEGSQV